MDVTDSSNDPGVCVREARVDEFEVIRSLCVAANAEFRDAMGESVHAAYVANVLDVAARAEAAIVLVAMLGDELVGTVTLYADANDEGMPIHFPPRTAGLRATAVRPDARSHGVGSRLVSELVARANNAGATRVALHTAPCMHAAQRLYQRHDFRRASAYDYVANDFFGTSRERPLEALAFIRELPPRIERYP